MEWKNNVPLFIQIEDEIIKYILENKVKPNEKLPSVRQLSSNLLVNPNTIAKVYLSLQLKNIVYSKESAGYYLTDNKEALDSYIKEKALKLKDDFIDSMEKIGYGKEEIISLIKEGK